MPRYIARRLLGMVPVVWAAATLVWIFMFLIPGDPARLLAGQIADPDVLAAVRAEWGLDHPVLARYGQFLGMLARLDLGTSYVQRQPVSKIVFRGTWRTLFLAVTASALGPLIGLALGALSAARRGTPLDGAALAISTASFGVPSFWLGLMLQLLLASWLDWLPTAEYGEGGSLFGMPLPGPAYLVLPSLTLAIASGGYLSRVTRAALIEELSQPYARAARARGVSPAGTLLRHALTNSMLPIVTLAGLDFGQLLGGAIAVETVFNWHGLGSVMKEALKSRDLPVIEGGVIVLTAAFLLVNLAVDISYGFLDPRVRD